MLDSGTFVNEHYYGPVNVNHTCDIQTEGGEDALLDRFEGLVLHCDPDTQLVVTCEVCRRPATKECWTCGMKICKFCTLKRHWKVNHLVCLGHRGERPQAIGHFLRK